MGSNEPESQGLSLQVQETAQWANIVLEGRIPRVRWATGKMVANAKGDCSTPLLEQCSSAAPMLLHTTLVWSSAVSAVVWNLESGALHPLGLLISVLAPLMASGDYPQEPSMGGPAP